MFVIEEVVMGVALSQSARELTFDGLCSVVRPSNASVYFGCALCRPP